MRNASNSQSMALLVDVFQLRSAICTTSFVTVSLPRLDERPRPKAGMADQVGEIERMERLRRFLPPQVADLIVASGTDH